MKKEELYDPVKTGSFRMMFGFKQPSTYRPQKWVSIKKPKEEKNEVRKQIK
jgi:hypothetical protein